MEGETEKSLERVPYKKRKWETNKDSPNPPKETQEDKNPIILEEPGSKEEDRAKANPPELEEEAPKKLELKGGDHIKVVCKFAGVEYWHHGIYIGDGEIVHFSREDNGVGKVTLQKFQGSADCVEIVDYSNETGTIFPPEQIVTRALGAVGIPETYNLLTNNCEHFATWCVTHKKASKQIEDAFKPSSIINKVKEFKDNFSVERIRELGEAVPTRETLVNGACKLGTQTSNIANKVRKLGDQVPSMEQIKKSMWNMFQ
jgi:hypothetical protein